MAMAGDGTYSTMQKITPGAYDAPNIESEYAELLALHTARCADFELDRVVAHGSQGTTFCVRCRMEGLPAECENKLYALKVFYHFSVSPSDDHLESFRRARQNEWQVLSRLLRHRNIIRIWTCFEDTIGDAYWKELPEKAREAILRSSGGEHGRRLAQFVVFDHYEQPIRDVLQQLGHPLPYRQAKQWSMQLLEVARYLKTKHIVHCDMKLDHILLTPNREMVVTGFSCAKHLKEHFFFPYSRCASPGGSEANLAPEVLTEFAKLRTGPQESHHAVDYGHQTAWAVGVIIYELVTGRRPLVDYPAAFTRHNGQVVYTLDDVEHLPAVCGDELDVIVRGLLEPDPTKRLGEEEAMQKVFAIPDGSIHARLGEVEQQLADERQRRQKAEVERDKANELKVNLVKERVRLVNEKKDLQARLAELERSCEKSKSARGAQSERDNEEAWHTLSANHTEAEAKLDAVVRERDAYIAQVRQLREEADKSRKELAELSQQRDKACVEAQRLARDAAGLKRDLESLSSRENRFALELKQVKEGHLITMTELETVRRQSDESERINVELRRRLEEREKEVLDQRALLDGRSSASDRMFYNTQRSNLNEASTASPVLPLRSSHTSSPSILSGSPAFTSTSTGNGRLQSPVSTKTTPTGMAVNPTGFIHQVSDAIRNSFSGFSKPDGASEQLPSQPGLLPNLPEERLGRGMPTLPLDERFGRQSDKCRTPGCTFYGHSSYDFYCSKCSEERRHRNFTAPAAILSQNEATNGEKSARSQSQGNFTGPIRLPLSYEEETVMQSETATATNPRQLTRLCSERGCEFCGSKEYGGRCFRCFMEMTKKEAGPRAEHNVNDQYAAASTLPAIMMRQERQAQHPQSSYSPTVPGAAQACLNPVCPRYGSREMNGLCASCHRSGYQAL